MNLGLKYSIERAISLLKTPHDYENYISIKIRPVERGCCCFHCWPTTWDLINEYISPCGPLLDEGDVLINKNNEKFVLECHESGPEIIVYLGVTTASLLLIKSVIDLITTLLKALQTEKGKRPFTLEVTKRRQIAEKIAEEEIMRIALPLDEDTIKELNDNIKDAFEWFKK
jgi:hypothetical protein